MVNDKLFRIRPQVRTILCLVAMLGALAAGNLHAQKNDDPGPVRKLVSRVDAQYPPDLKRAFIGGVVRLNVVVTARGSVDYVEVAGGNPILADAAMKAVKQWKYSPASTSTNIQISIKFDPTH